MEIKNLKAEKVNVAKAIASTSLTSSGMRKRSKNSGKFTNCYKTNHTYFSKIDSEEKAYWLGFIVADGNIYENRLQVEVHNQDGAHLEKLAAALRYPARKRKTREATSLSPRSDQIVSDLQVYGVTKRKSYTMEPVAPPGYELAFWRGVFDGDGYLSKQDGAKTEVSLVGSLKTCERFGEFVFKETGHEAKPSAVAHADSTFRIRYSGSRGVALAKFLYPEGCYALERKARRALGYG